MSPNRPIAFRLGAFTLIEIMMVVGIMGLILTMGVPLVYKVTHRAPMNQAVTDIFEVLSNARARAILQGKPLNLIIRPKDGRFEVEGAAGTRAGTGPVQAGMNAGTGAGTSAQLSEHVAIVLLDINKLQHDFREDDVAKVRFFPNGTSDELTIILQSDRGEQRGITLEVTTGLASVLNEADLQRLRNGVL